MEALYQPFTSIPLHEVGIQGLIYFIAIIGALIFKIKLRAPKSSTSRMLKDSSTGARHVQVCTGEQSRAGRFGKTA